MRSYDQYCGLAQALDVVGDRWTLLIVRELFIGGACRYTDLQHGLPGIATNLLADRLRQLEEHGVITREAAPPPVATTLFRLTPRGEELRPVLTALGRWGAPLLADVSDDAKFRSHWLVLPLQIHLADHAPDRPPAAIEVRTGDEPLTVEVADGEVLICPGAAPAPDVTISGGPPVVAQLLFGQLALDAAVDQGVVIEGDPAVLARVQPAVLGEGRQDGGTVRVGGSRAGRRGGAPAGT
jgi:DNA-binding HxlR family transcriptional regulator